MKLSIMFALILSSIFARANQVERIKCQNPDGTFFFLNRAISENEDILSSTGLAITHSRAGMQSVSSKTNGPGKNLFNIVKASFTFSKNDKEVSLLVDDLNREQRKNNWINGVISIQEKNNILTGAVKCLSSLFTNRLQKELAEVKEFNNPNPSKTTPFTEFTVEPKELDGL